MSRLSNTVLGIAQNIANSRGSKLKIELREDSIQYSFEKASKSKSKAWENYYANAGIFIKGYAQEIKLDPESIREGKVELTEKAKLEPVFNANLSKSLWGFAHDSDRQEQLNYIIIAGIAIVIFMMMV